MAKATAQRQQRKSATESDCRTGDGAEILAIVDRLVRRPEIAALQDEVYSIRAVARGELNGFDLSHPIEWVRESARLIADRLTRPVGRQTRDDIERLPVLLERLGHRNCEQCDKDFVWGDRKQALCGGCIEANLKAARPPDTLGKLVHELRTFNRLHVGPDREMLEVICRDEYGDFNLNSVLRVRAKLVRSGEFASPAAVDNLLIAGVVKWLSVLQDDWLGPHSPSEWAKELEISLSTFRRMRKDKRLRADPVSSKLIRLHPADVKRIGKSNP